MNQVLHFKNKAFDIELGVEPPENKTISYSGFPPFTNGPYASMYVAQPWTIRQYAGFSTAEASNQFYKQNLKAGQKGLSIAFDLPTHRGYDSDHPRVRGDVGKAGVAIDTVEDMMILFEGIPLDEISVSMTMNGAVIPILAFFIVAAERNGIQPSLLAGTIQNDILKEFLVRNTYIYPPEASMRLVTDIFKYTAQYMPKFNAISVSGYHMLEAGAPPHLELAFTLADGYEYLEYGKKSGLNIDAFAARISFFFGIGMNLIDEIAKLRAARTMWSSLISQAGGKNDKSKMLRTHCQTSGWSLTQQDITNNITRTAIEGLAAVLGGTQSLHTNSMDEAISLPTNETAAIARNTQLYLQKNSGIKHWVDVIDGAAVINNRVQSMINESHSIHSEVLGMGGMTKAIQSGYPKRKIEEAAVLRQAKIDSGEEKIIGMNVFAREKEAIVETLNINHQEVFNNQILRLAEVRKKRNPSQVNSSLKAITKACKNVSSNILTASIEAARSGATLGEISSAIELAFGRYQAPVSGLSTIYGSNSMKNKYFKKAFLLVQSFEKKYGRRPRILIAKIGQDGHDRGAKIIAAGFADIGFDVDMGPLFQTSLETARQAVENDVHFIGVSTLAGAHMALIPELIDELRIFGREDIKIIAGGIIPAKDHEELFKLGVIAIFGPGTNLAEAAVNLLKLMK
ncbi:MAG: methylmalonyl-CoA mutase [Saprospiraceae bacterium]